MKSGWLGNTSHLHRLFVGRRGIDRRAMDQLVAFGVEIDQSADALHGRRAPGAACTSRMLFPLRRLFSGVAARAASAYPSGWMNQRICGTPSAVVLPAALHDELERLVLGQAAAFLIAHAPAQNALDDLEIVGHDQQIARQAIERLAGRGFRSAGPPCSAAFIACRRLLLLRHLCLRRLPRPLAALQRALAGLFFLFRNRAGRTG